MNDTEAKWPSITSSILISKYIAECQPACDDWGTQHVKIYSFSNSFKRAKSKAERLIETSAISSDSPDGGSDFQRKRKRPVRFQSSRESSDEESQSLIYTKQYPLPRLPGSIREPPKKVISNTQAFSQTEDVAPKQKNDTTQTALFQRMFKYMEGLSSQMNELNEKVDRIMERTAMPSLENTLDFLPFGMELPITTEEELRVFNEKLKDRELSAVIVRYLHGVGNGKTACSFVLSLTKKILAQDLAMQFSRYGRKGKKSFSAFNETMTVILAAAAMKYKDLEKEKLSDMFGKALAGVAEWNGRRIRPSDVLNLNLSLQ